MSEIGQRKSKIEVKEALKGIAAEMHNKMEKGVPPSMTLPVRAKTNIGFDNKLGVYKYGKKKSTYRPLIYYQNQYLFSIIN